MAAARDAAEAAKAGDEAVVRSEYTAAMRHFSDAIEADPHSAMLFHKRASAHISLGDHAGGARDLSAALEIEPHSIKLLLQRWALKTRLGQSVKLKTPSRSQKCDTQNLKGYCLLSGVCLNLELDAPRMDVRCPPTICALGRA